PSRRWSRRGPPAARPAGRPRRPARGGAACPRAASIRAAAAASTSRRDPAGRPVPPCRARSLAPGFVAPRRRHGIYWRDALTLRRTMDFTLTPEQERFRAEVRAWLAANLPPDWATRPVTDTPRTELHQLGRQWQRKLHDAGLLGLTWPREYGGRGLSWMEELIFHEELVRHRAPPPLNILGLGMAGPTIIAYGTEAQK